MSVMLTRQKPVYGTARLNWNNPLTRGLVWCVMPGGNWQQELVSGDLGTTYGTGSFAGVTAYGQAASNGSTGNSGIYWPFSERFNSIGSKFTILVIADPETVTTGGKLFCIPYRTTNTWGTPWIALALGRDAATTGIVAEYAEGTTYRDAHSATGMIDATDPLTVYAVTRDGTSVTFYRNGTPHGIGTNNFTATGAPDFTSRADPSLLHNSRYYTGNIEGIVGTSSAAMVWNRALSADEMMRVSLNPFSILSQPTTIQVATAQYARPSADVTDGAWLRSDTNTNVDLYTMIDETTANDADYIYSKFVDGVADTFEVQLSSVTDPNSSSGHTVTVRMKKDAASGDTVNVTLYLVEGATVRSTSSVFTLTDAWADYSWTLSAAEADAITNYADLRIRGSAIRG